MTPAAPAGSPSDEYMHFINGRGEAVRVGIPSGIMAKKGAVKATSREGNGNPLQYSCLENPMDGGAWWAAVHGVAKSRTRLGDFTFPFHFHALEKEMATHSNVLAWRIPGMGERGGLPWGHTESDTTEVT